MNKCLKITISIKGEDNLLNAFIQKNAKKLNIEGIAQVLDKKRIKIIACGEIENMDDFIDALYQGYKKTKPFAIEIEPFLRDKDYRGVFRIIQ